MYVELSGCFGEIQVIFKESADDRQRLTVDRIKRLITEDFFDEHLANRDRELVDQTPDTKGTISEYSTFSIKDLTDFECCACFFICTGKFTEIVGGIAVGNPCLCHGLCAEHINQHMSGIFEIFISFRRRKFTNNDDATVIDRSDKIVCACRKDIFDRLWRWGKKYMQHQEGPLKGYFAWSCKTDGTRNAQGPASDGELYYVTSLIFASNRWGNSTGINYLAEAQNILDCSMQKIGMERVAPLINLEHQLITFTPDPFGGRFTDPSYHVPAFYEVWARWAEDGRSEFWRVCARKSREYLHKSIHPVTGLNPDYNNYDGTLLGSKRVIGDAFRFDSWRVPMNIALDYSWACADRKWQQEYGNKIQNFFYSQGIDSFVDQYNVDGTTVTELLGAGGYKKLRHSLGLVATTAAVSLVCTHDKSREFVDRLWNVKHVPYDDGYFDAYYDGLLRLFAFMHLSGNYRIIFPQGH